MQQKQEQLVAVASFSSRRKIVRRGQPHKSHELIRFCTQRQIMVVGGISKLLRAFVVDQQPDDIVTVVDRDWGPGDGWHGLGFETVHIMPPLVMVVDSAGKRRHLVGAGIQTPPDSSSADTTDGSTTNDNTLISSERFGLEQYVLDELKALSSPTEAMQCLDRHGYHPVYDVGVERLFMVVPKQQPKQKQKQHLNDSNSSAVTNRDLWEQSVPSYTASYYSNNSGIASLLSYSEAPSSKPATTNCTNTVDTPLSKTNNNNITIDSSEADEDKAQLRATGGTKGSKLIFSSPSSLDEAATVEVRERPGGWCTLGIVGGATKSIYHGIYKLESGAASLDSPSSFHINPSVLVAEHLRTMASVALACLEGRNRDDGGDNNIQLPDGHHNDILSFLYFGYGAGTLSRFMAHTIPDSHHDSVELDRGVVEAAKFCHLVGPSEKSQLYLMDALKYRRFDQPAPYDCLFVDIFDGDNLLPEGFYSTSFLEHVRTNLLSNHDGRPGMVVHNFHTGNKKLQTQLEEATKSYQKVFPTTITVESTDSRPTGGNTILLATTVQLDQNQLQIAGDKARRRWGVNFDVSTRSTHALRQSMLLS